MSVWLPGAGSVWREHDSRFERFVRVVGFAGLEKPIKGGPKVLIETTSRDGKVGVGRKTRASPGAFGKRYRLVSAGADARPA